MPNVYKTLIETLPQKIFYKDCKSVYISCNNNFARDLRIKPEKITGKTDYDFFPSELAEKYRADDKRVISRGITEDIVEHYVLNGHNNYVRTIKAPVKDAEGTIIGVMGIFWDITESKQAEEDLKKYRKHLEKLVDEKTVKFAEVNEQLKKEIEAHKQVEDKLRLMFDSASEAIIILDLKGNIKELNNTTLALYQYTNKGELIGCNALKLIAQKDHNKARDNFRRTIKEGIINKIECTFVTRNGHEFAAEMSSSLLRDKSGKPVEFFAILRDISERKHAEELLKESEMKYKILAENSLTGIYIHQDGKYVFVNEGFAMMHGYTREELIGKDYMLLNHPDDRKMVKNRVSCILRGENKWRIGENRRVKKDGTTIWCQLIVNVINYKGNPAIMGNVIDITERKKAEEALRDEATRRRILIEQSSDGIVVLDQGGKVHEANRRFAEMLGYSIEEAHDLHVWDWDTQWTREQLLGMIRSVGSSGDRFETNHRRKDGSTIQVEICTNGAICGGQKLVFCVCRDITERKQMERKLSDMATHDALTGLPNRILLTDRFDVAVAQAKRRTNNVAIMMLDLDHFKYVNDTLGHDIGDKLLKAAGNMLVSSVRKSDTVARIGGDEFVLLFPEINNLRSIHRIAQKILDDFKKPFHLDGHRISITTSIGIAVYPSDGNNFESLLTSADKAMYQAKEEGRNNYKYTRSTEIIGII